MDWVVLALALDSEGVAADCDTRPSEAEVAGRLDLAESAYAELDVNTFSTALDEAALMLPCLGEVATPKLAARYHRAVGLRLFTDRDAERAGQAFASARALDPDYVFSEALVPAGHAVRKLYESVGTSAGGQPLPAPVQGEIRVDGAPGGQRPSQRPMLVQLLDADGNVLATAYLFPGQPLPPYESRSAPAASSCPWAGQEVNATATMTNVFVNGRTFPVRGLGPRSEFHAVLVGCGDEAASRAFERWRAARRLTNLTVAFAWIPPVFVAPPVFALVAGNQKAAMLDAMREGR